MGIDRARVRHWLPPIVATAILPVPVIGWGLGQSLDERIAENSQFTGAMIHVFVVDVFATIFLASAVINAVIVWRRFPDDPRSYRLSRYVVWQLAAIALGVAWITCIAIGESALTIEAAIGMAVAVVSIIVCVFAAKTDSESSLRRDQRLQLLRERRTPEQDRRRRIARIVVPVALASIAVAAIATAQLTEVEHHDCSIMGWGEFSPGGLDFYTNECGDFSVDQTHLSKNDVLAAQSNGRVDITTRGYSFELIPKPLAIALD
jgi:hypothetical protein